MPGLEDASRAELLALIARQAQMIEQLTARVAELARLGRNSRNSSPPSADGPQGAPRRSRRGSRRKPGKQPGAPGSTLTEPLVVLRRQVHDIPPVRPVIVEHRMHRRRRGCGAVTVVARFPQPRAIVRPYRAADHKTASQRLPDPPGVLTGPEFFPELRAHRGRTLTLIDRAESTGHTWMAEMNTQVLTNLDRMISEVEDTQSEAADAG